MALPKDVTRLIENFQTHFSDYKKNTYNEARLRKEYLDPFFEALGWDMANKQGHHEAYKEVIHEDSVKVGGSMKAPDYSFRIGGVRKFFLEAKKPSVFIKEEIPSAYQIRRYAWSAGLPLSILSDFEEFAVYDTSIRPKPDDKASTARVFYCSFNEYEKHWDYLYNTFSKEAIFKGSFDNYARDAKAKKGTSTVDREFLKEIEKWRFELAKNIALRNNLSTREINYAVQLTIDRVLFLRICEDRGIEDYEQLRNLCAKKEIYKNLFSIFDKADKKYNSGLFHFKQEKEINTPPDTVTPGITIDDKILKEILSRLYYPDSPYEFSVISADILGNVYEQFLGKVIVPKGKSAIVEEKPEVRKAGGVYYTPKYIVDYIVENTLGEALKNKTPRMIAGEAKGHNPLRLVDPACGSGSFLIAAYDYLLKWHRDWYASHTPEKFKKAVFKGAGNQWYLTTSEKKKILTNNIFGVDIDPQAVEVTKLNLLLKVLEDESKETINSQMKIFHERVLPDLGNNIKCGNSLIGSDFYGSPESSRRLDTPLRGTRRPSEAGVQQNLFETMSEDEKEKINVFDWEEEWPEIFGRGVSRYKSQSDSLDDRDDSRKNAKSGGFDVVIGNPPYVFGLSTHEKNFFQSKYVSAQYQLDLYPLFIEQAVTIAKKNGSISFITPNSWLKNLMMKNLRKYLLDKISFLKIVPNLANVFKGASVDALVFIAANHESKANTKIKIYEYKNKFEKLHDYSQEKLRSNIDFVFDVNINETVGKIIDKFKSLKFTFNDIFDITRGVNPYDKYTGQSAETIKNKIYHANYKKDKTFVPEIRGKHVSRYNYLWDNEHFISYGKWLAAPRDMKYFSGERILLREILGETLISTYLDEDFINDRSLYNAKLKENHKLNIKYAQGLLASKLYVYCFRYIKNEFDDLFPKIRVAEFKQLPIRVIDFDNPDDKAMHNQMVQLVDRMLTLNKRLPEIPTPHEKTRVQREIDATDREIDRLVYRLYDLTEAEIKIVENN
ncbi:MAG: N-6 DNA methylase [Spirochaetia bacterium]|nr:N-6 DNA methylase [Spirochaetia bacterium]